MQNILQKQNFGLLLFQFTTNSAHYGSSLAETNTTYSLISTKRPRENTVNFSRQGFFGLHSDVLQADDSRFTVGNQRWFKIFEIVAMFVEQNSQTSSCIHPEIFLLLVQQLHRRMN